MVKKQEIKTDFEAIKDMTVGEAKEIDRQMNIPQEDRVEEILKRRFKK